MEGDEFLHEVSVRSNVNIELLKDLYQDDRFWSLVSAGKITDATLRIRSLQPMIGLMEAKMVAEAFAKEGKH